MPDERREIVEALGDLAAALERLRLGYALIGGVAVNARGYERPTVDIDAVILNADQDLGVTIDGLINEGFASRHSDVVSFARLRRVILLTSRQGVQVDLSLGALPFEEEVVMRATAEDLGASALLPVATPEDLIIMKLVAGRQRDLNDVLRLVELYPNLDRPRIRSIVREFAEVLEQPEIAGQMEQMLK